MGQNVATTWSYNRMPPNKDKPEFARHVMGWFDEVSRYQWRPRDIEPFSFRMDTGHYTQVRPVRSDSKLNDIQLVWADTYMVGCGYTYYDDKKRGYSKLYVCNYGPGGNLVGGVMVSLCVSAGLLTVTISHLSIRWDSPGCLAVTRPD